MLIATAYALSGFYERRHREPMLARPQHIEGEDEATLITAAYILSGFYKPRRHGRILPIRRHRRIDSAIK